MDGFMRTAIDEARAGMAEGGLPVGAVLVQQGRVLGRGRNRLVQRDDSTAHAEIECLRASGRLESYADCTLYTTMMPCLMCTGAVAHLGIQRVVVAESETYQGFPALLRSHGVEVVDLQLDVVTTMLATFIRDHPRLWEEASRAGAVDGP
jgi:cytosine/creatinine deaminase